MSGYFVKSIGNTQLATSYILCHISINASFPYCSLPCSLNKKVIGQAQFNLYMQYENFFQLGTNFLDNFFFEQTLHTIVHRTVLCLGMAWRLASSKTMFLVYVVQKPAQFFSFQNFFMLLLPKMTIFSYYQIKKIIFRFQYF